MSFPRVLGQERAKAVLAGYLASNHPPHALLFSGPEGVGKTLLALEFAKALLGSDKEPNLDLVRVNPAAQAALREEEVERQKTLRVETIRHLRRQMELRPLAEGWKVAVVEEAHTLEIEAANALLKILEEPGTGTLWILTSSQRERLPKTVLSRLARVPFGPLPEPVVRDILAAQGVAPERARAAAALCEGSASRALELAARELPESLLAGPLAAVEASEALPKELASARLEVERALFALGQSLRLRHLEGRLSWARAGRPLEQLERLRAALRANADPKAILLLACLEAEAALAC